MADTNLTSLTAEIVASFVAGNAVRAEALPDLITSVYGSLVLIRDGKASEPLGAAKAKISPAQIRKSITPDALISFLDGKGYRTLRRHLTHKGYTPERYFEEFGLPQDYPLVAPNYSKARSAMAIAAGLGSKGRRPAPDKTRRGASAA